MSKNYYPQMMDEIARKDVSQQEILDYFYRHKPHSVIEAVQAVRKAKLHPSKAEIDRFMAQYSPEAPVKAEPDYADECRRIREKNGRVYAIKFWREKTGCGLSNAIAVVDAL